MTSELGDSTTVNKLEKEYLVIHQLIHVILNAVYS